MKSDECFQSFWYGPSLSPQEWLCLSSFVRRGLNFHLYSYDDNLSVPEGVVLKDARKIYPEDKVFFYQKGPGKGSVAVFANMFRYKLLYDSGGWWVDTDVIYSGAPIPSQPSYFGLERDGIVNCAIVRFETGSSIMQECMVRSEAMGSKVTWGRTGPHLLTEVIKEAEKIDDAASQKYAYPIPWGDVTAFYNPGRTDELKQKFEMNSVPFVHLWNEVLGRIGIQKNIAPPDGSYLAEVASELDADWPCPEGRYRWKTISRMASNYDAYRELQQIKEGNSRLRSAYASFRRTLGF